MVLDHSFLIFFSECLPTKLNDMKLFNTFIWFGYKRGSSFRHHIVNAFLEAILNRDVAKLFSKTFFEIGHLRFELSSDVTF